MLKKCEWLLYLNHENCVKTLNSNNKKINRILQRYCNFNDLLSLILDIDEDLKESYYFLIRMDSFYRDSTLDNPIYVLDNIINSANISNVDQINAFGNTFICWRKEIINSFYIIEEIIDQDGVVTYRKMNNGIAKIRIIL
ncbi:MAG: transposase [Erysipelothrix sp.]|nr:transposase [Erysipelothrix sp.]